MLRRSRSRICRPVKLEDKELQLAQQQPKVDAYDVLMDAEGYYCMEAVGKIIGVGRNTLFKRLRDMGVIEPAPSRLPYQKYMRYFTVTASSWTDKDGNTNVSYTPKVHPKGLRFILGTMHNHVPKGLTGPAVNSRIDPRTAHPSPNSCRTDNVQRGQP
jgi:phage antirepressor YoqD-like protein